MERHWQRSIGVAFLLFCLVVTWGCETKTIQNLADIEAEAHLRLTSLEVRLYLLTDTGERLRWESSLVGPVGDVLPIEDLDTYVEVWSLRDGQRNKRVYAGRLRGLTWSIGQATSHRSLVGDVPLYAYAVDPEADSALGEIDVTLTTPNQGDFSNTIFNVQIFSAGGF